MPEWAEVRLMGEFASKVLAGKSVLNIKQNPVSKNKDTGIHWLLPAYKAEVFNRGKATIIKFTTNPGGASWKMKFNYGMTGHWKHNKTRFGDKHTMLSLALGSGTFLEFVDPRRFGGWKSDVGMTFNNGPDPVYEFDSFSGRIAREYKHDNDFNKPVCEVLLNQRWFNGIGNYLRSTIIHRLDINPFQKFSTLTADESFKIIWEAKVCCEKAYDLKGASLATWKNPETTTSSELYDFIFYKKGLGCKDRNGRTFWFDRKWRAECPYEILYDKYDKEAV